MHSPEPAEMLERLSGYLANEKAAAQAAFAKQKRF